MKLNDTSPMPFGKHQGVEMENVPAHYLIWLHSELQEKIHMTDEQLAVKAYVDDNAEVLEKEGQRR
jgi:hypothetical protein